MDSNAVGGHDTTRHNPIEIIFIPMWRQGNGRRHCAMCQLARCCGKVINKDQETCKAHENSLIFLAQHSQCVHNLMYMVNFVQQRIRI